MSTVTSDFFGNVRATSSWSILRVAGCNSNGASASSRRFCAQVFSWSSTFLLGSSGISFKSLDGRRRNILSRKHVARNFFEVIQAFAQARTDGLHVQLQGVADFLVTQITEITKLDDLSYEEISKDRKSTRLNSSHVAISYAVFCL